MKKLILMLAFVALTVPSFGQAKQMPYIDLNTPKLKSVFSLTNSQKTAVAIVATSFAYALIDRTNITNRFGRMNLSLTLKFTI